MSERIIYKYELDLALGLQVIIPGGAKFLSLQVQNEVPVMWWSVPKKSGNWPLRTFVIVPTGFPGYTDNLFYVGTFQLGGFVGHVFSHEAFEKEKP